jgi:hypothetical protein
MPFFRAGREIVRYFGIIPGDESAGIRVSIPLRTSRHSNQPPSHPVGSCYSLPACKGNTHLCYMLVLQIEDMAIKQQLSRECVFTSKKWLGLHMFLRLQCLLHHWPSF